MSKEECCRPLSYVPPGKSIPPALFPSSFDIRCWILCGSLPRSRNGAVDGRIPRFIPQRCYLYHNLNCYLNAAGVTGHATAQPMWISECRSSEVWRLQLRSWARQGSANQLRGGQSPLKSGDFSYDRNLTANAALQALKTLLRQHT